LQEREISCDMSREKNFSHDVKKRERHDPCREEENIPRCNMLHHKILQRDTLLNAKSCWMQYSLYGEKNKDGAMQ
jgi:hypothetical protein